MITNAIDCVAEGVLAADSVCVRDGRPVDETRAVRVPDRDPCGDSLAAAEGLPESDGHGLSEADAEAEPVADGRLDRVPVFVAVFVRVAVAVFVISRVLVEVGVGPPLTKEVVERADTEADRLTDCDPDAVRVSD